MVLKIASLLFILPVILAHVQIDVSISKDGERLIRTTGDSDRLITEAEMKTFGLTEEVLKKSIWSYFGALPDNVYYKSPTLWGDLYKTLNWEPVRRIVTPLQASVLSFTKEPTLLMKKELFNNKTEDFTFKTEFRHFVANTVSAAWDKEGDFDVEMIRHHFDFNMLIDSRYFSFSSKWGENFRKTMPMTLASEVQMTLKPGQHLIAELTVTKRTVMLRVDFETTLAGTVAVNFDKEFKGHRFWSVDINTLLTSDGLKKAMYSTEMMELVHFTDAMVHFKDVNTNEIVSSVPLNFF